MAEGRVYRSSAFARRVDGYQLIKTARECVLGHFELASLGLEAATNGCIRKESLLTVCNPFAHPGTGPDTRLDASSRREQQNHHSTVGRILSIALAFIICA